MNQQDEQLINGVVQEVQGFVTMLNQVRVGFSAVFSNVMERMVTEYRNKTIIIQDQQKTIEEQRLQIASLEKELDIIRKSGERTLNGPLIGLHKAVTPLES